MNMKNGYNFLECIIYGGSSEWDYYSGFSLHPGVFLEKEDKKILRLIFCKSGLRPGR